MSKRKMVSERLMVRQSAKYLAGARGHQIIFGSPEQIADGMQEWFDYEAADGYHLLSTNII